MPRGTGLAAPRTWSAAEARLSGPHRRVPDVRYSTDTISAAQGKLLNKCELSGKGALTPGVGIFAFPDAQSMVEAFKKLEFMAVLDIHPSEMAQMADIQV